MSATIVDILEYRKKTASVRNEQEPEKGLLKAEIYGPDSHHNNGETSSSAAHVQSELNAQISSYEMDLVGELDQLEKTIRRAVRNTEMRMTIKIALMFTVSVFISSMIIIAVL
jgi:hypothetical protein